MRPFTIKQIDHLVLRVRDLPRSVAFYTELLGCTVSRVREDLGMVHLATGAAMIDLVTLDGPLGQPGGAAPG
ncbi:VOC family protein, partial [Pseudomonas putida]